MVRKVATPHDEDDGFVAARANPFTNDYVVLYDGYEAGFQTDTGRWTLFCQNHGSMTQETSKARAKKLLQTPDAWCDACSAVRFGPVTLKVVALDTESPEALDQEMRFWARRTKASSEKQKLFEKMYGVKPDGYWD